MRTLESYIETAKKRSGANSDRKLGALLGASPALISAYKTGRSFPSDDLMIHIAHIAGIDPTQALLDLNVWRAPEKVKPHYMKIMSRVSAAALSVAILAFPALAHAGILENVASSGGQYILWEIQEAF